MGAAAAKRQPELAGLLHKARVTRDDRTVRIHLDIEGGELGMMTRMLTDN